MVVKQKKQIFQAVFLGKTLFLTIPEIPLRFLSFMVQAHDKRLPSALQQAIMSTVSPFSVDVIVEKASKPFC